MTNGFNIPTSSDLSVGASSRAPVGLCGGILLPSLHLPSIGGNLRDIYHQLEREMKGRVAQVVSDSTGFMGRRTGAHAIVMCSALKHQYRQILLYGSKALTSSPCPDQEIPRPTISDVFFLFLHGDYNLIHQRMVARSGHFMNPDLLGSQFDTLEPPLDEENVLVVDIRRSVAEMAMDIEKHLVSLKVSPIL